jgi:two-component system, NarL family, nitrate/nitrite response regulator NarL
LEATRQLCLIMPEVKVLILTLHTEPSYIDQARQVGAVGYALKNDNGDKLLRTINAVGDGLCVSPPVTATGVPSSLPIPLSPRETEVLILVAKGKQSGEIARILGIETRTVEAHRQKIRDKGLRTVADQTRYAIEQGWV